MIINDFDRSIYAFWHSVLNNTERFCNIIEKTPVNLKVWEKQKEIQKKKEEVDLLELGFSTFFLNRTNRSGIIMAGAIGGRKQLGKWKIDARYNKSGLINRIRKIADFRNSIELYNKNAVNLLNELSQNLRKILFFI